MSASLHALDPATFRTDFVRFAIDSGVLRFGSFKTKAGRMSPYFFNAGLFNSGATVGKLAAFYAQALMAANVEFDMLFGPAYKGIGLATATSVALVEHGRDVPFAYNRKEAKDHGEGGTLVGAPMQGKVVIIDDVISAGTSVNESVAMIRAAGATPSAVLIALDRMERAGADDALSAHSATQEVSQRYGIPVISIASLADILALAEQGTGGFDEHREAVLAYRARYGVN
ncbi:orotate phosphoribosyltransferase [Pigmentiphaga aceris]|uniref:Orotate phosphoribosyltransferase n=1 Tax=Pigmentiphaga aceris TaxID=1940612 RepID=A0A5C0B812_9BURK|nr:orotate phosphoribosyltransferase [Pigmentiphaga aceris]QEI08947.1 orotate phosphoribosyltransferase [Pigmentiphaga aceris]